MAHYAFLDDDGIVTEVIVGRDEDDLVDGVTDWEQWYGDFRGQVCKRTSYNTYFDMHGTSCHRTGGTPFRGTYAGVGFRFLPEADAFSSPQPFASWSLNEQTGAWIPPVPYPSDGARYAWEEETESWVAVSAG